MGLIKAIKKFKWGYLFIATVLCAVGLCFLMYPTQSLRTASYVIGGVALVGGIIQVVKTLANRKRGFSFAFSIIFSACVIICAMVAFFAPDAVFKVYPMMIGLFIIIDGSFKLQTVINAKRYNLKMWWFLLIICCLAILGGFLLIRLQYSQENATLYTTLFGCSLFISGLQNFFTLFYLGTITKRASKHLESEEEKAPEDAVLADSNPPTV